MYNIKPDDVSISYVIGISSECIDLDINGDCWVIGQIEFLFKFNKLDKSVNLAMDIYIPFSIKTQQYDFNNISESGTFADWQLTCDDSEFIESKEIIDFI